MNVMSEKEILSKLADIAIADNDSSLNIPDWYKKMKSELKYHRNSFEYIKKVATINYIPIDLVEAIDYHMKQELEGE